ncbi:MAG TPA: hypothetical protein VKR58_07870, partial [Aquella sp.]|nr:hypothetical protein [Aquella sp.]
MKHKYVLVLLVTIATLSGFQLPVKNIISFKTASGHVIKVVNGQILYDTKSIFKIKYGDDILYESKSNRLIEDHGSIFLFIAMAGNPNLD